MVLEIALHIAQIQETQPKAPDAIVGGQSEQPISDQCIII